VKRSKIVEADLAQITTSDLPWAALAGRNVLVTGANGFVPAYLVETLLYLNEHKLKKRLRVYALVRNKKKAAKRFSAYRGRTDLKFLVQDVSVPIKTKVRMDYIVHAASQASPKYYGVDPAGTIAPNVIGTFHLLELARRTGTRGFLFLSSGDVYGKFQTPPTRPVTEDEYGSLNPLELRACYPEGKRAGETMCKAWHHQYGVPTKIARLGHTYGPGMDLNDGRVFADFVANVVREESIELKSDGSATRPFCYLADAVTGLFTVLLKGQPATAYNVINDAAWLSIAELAEVVCRLSTRKKLRVIYPRRRTSSAAAPQWNSGFRVDTSRARGLGWCPTITPEDGFDRTIKFYQTETLARP
jgi:nucleoside-diphosphate-sugar epimerase